MRRRFSGKPPPCAELDPDDGVDPRSKREPGRRSVVNRKALQLCEQIARTLSCVLAGECRDDRLRELLVESVQPAPDSTRLLVSLYLGPSAPGVETDELLQSLRGAARMLRSAVANAICRKRVPELVFRLVTLAPNPQ